MGAYVASEMVKALIQKGIAVKGARLLVLGLTFKENCPDLRNTRIVDVVSELRDYGIEVDVHDPWVDADEAMHEYGIALTDAPEADTYDGVILAVAHTSFRDMGLSSLSEFARDPHVFCDLKSVFPRDESDLRL